MHIKIYKGNQKTSIDQKKIFATDTADKALVFKMYKAFL